MKELNDTVFTVAYQGRHIINSLYEETTHDRI